MDDFSSYAIPAGQTHAFNLASLGSAWMVDGGVVDLYGPRDRDLPANFTAPGAGRFLDLAGTAGLDAPAGTLTANLTLPKGKWTLHFQLAGHQHRATQDTPEAQDVEVQWGPNIQSWSVGAYDGWTDHDFGATLSLRSTATPRLTFRFIGSGPVGPLLALVQVCAAPPPPPLETSSTTSSSTTSAPPKPIPCGPWWHDGFQAYALPPGQSHAYDVTALGSNWTVTAGSVDLYNRGDSDFSPVVGNGSTGHFVDLAGMVQAGTLTANITIPAGTWHLAFDLAGNSRVATTDRVEVRFGGLYDITSLRWDENFARRDFAWDLTLAAPTEVHFSFRSLGTGTHGPLLDNVVIAKVC